MSLTFQEIPIYGSLFQSKGIIQIFKEISIYNISPH